MHQPIVRFGGEAFKILSMAAAPTGATLATAATHTTIGTIVATTAPVILPVIGVALLLGAGLKLLEDHD